MQFEWINLAQSKQETVEKSAYAVPGFTLYITWQESKLRKKIRSYKESDVLKVFKGVKKSLDETY